MITTISRQGGRRYPQMRAAWSAHTPLLFGGAAVVITTALVGVWSNIVHCHSDQPQITLAAFTGAIDCHAGQPQTKAEATSGPIDVHGGFEGTR